MTTVNSRPPQTEDSLQISSPVSLPKAQSFYPDSFLIGDGYPDQQSFSVSAREEGKGFGVYTMVPFQRGQRVCRISGSITHDVLQHTLQISTHCHLYDPFFTGYLLHSCDPNAILDMQKFELWALKDIAAGDAITIDYTTTEDILFRQFPCGCGAPNCRGWITGRQETAKIPSAQG